MRNRQVRAIFICQAVILLIFLALTFTNEFLDLPHFLLGDRATTWGQRNGEICIELLIFIAVISLEVYLFKKLVQRIKILEGFLPICASCKKIRHQDQWEQIEKYISENSLVQFSHSLCPDCQKKLYPDIFGHR